MTTPSVFYLVVKIGDQNNTGGFRHGMPVSIHLDKNSISNWMLTVFAIFELPYKYKSLLREVLNPILLSNGVEAPRSAYFDIDRYVKDIGADYLIEQWKSPLPVQIQPCKVHNPEEYVHVSDFEEYYLSDLSVLDNNAITSGSYTVGFGGDYTSFTDAFADIGTLSGNLTLRQRGIAYHSVESVASFDLNGHSLFVTNDFRHNGIPVFGCSTFETTSEFSGSSMRFVLAGSGSINIDGIHFRDDINVPATAYEYAIRVTGASTPNITCNIHDCIFQSYDQIPRSGIRVDSSIIHNIWNCLFINRDRSVEVAPGVSGPSMIIENCTFFQSGLYRRGALTFRNCLILSPESWIEDQVIPVTDTAGNAISSEDGTVNTFPITEMGSPLDYTGLINSNIIESTDINDPNFCKIKSGSLAADGGQTVLIPQNNKGIRGNDRPTSGP